MGKINFFKIVIVLNNLLLSLTIYGQSVDFSIVKDPVCLNENVELSNNSIGYDSLVWNFCPYNFSEPLETNLLGSIMDGGRNLGIDFIRANGIWYGFATSWDKNKLFKLTFTDGIEAGPSQVEDLGNPGGLLSNPVSINSILYNDQVYLLVHNWNTKTMVRMSFPLGISSNQISSEIVVNNFGSVRSKMKTVKKNDSIYTFLINENNSTIEIINFGLDPTSQISDSEVIKTSPVSGLSSGRSIDVIMTDSINYVFVADYNLREIFRIDVSTNLSEGIVNTEGGILTSNFENNRINNIQLVKVDSTYEMHVNTLIGSLYKVEMGTDISKTNISSIPLKYWENESFTQGFTLFVDVINNKFYGLVIKDLNQEIYQIKKLNQCSANIEFSNDINPSNISYLEQGVKDISQILYYQNGNTASITKEITVTNNQAPDITFSTGDNLCITNPIAFNSTSAADITSYSWDFGDGNTSIAENPNHTYTAAGTYAVKVSVTDANGCNNSFQDSIGVFEEPAPDFQATAQGSICSQKPIVFENLTTLPTDATFEWDLGDGSTSTVENPEHIYSEAGDYTVTQIIEMAGCLVERTKTITVNPGPVVAFQTANNCLGEILKFENTSQGEFLDSYQWDFGDGTQSTQANPSHSYDTAGVYNVQLTAFTTNGCDFTISQEVEIQPLALVNFDSEIACAGQPTQFMEQVNIEESNVTDYFWDFGVLGTQSDVSTEASPQFAYPAEGSYNVTLQVTTSDGCTSSGSQQIVVNSAPNAAFEFEETCLGQTRLFSPLDTANSINHFWELQNSQGEILQTVQSAFFSYLFTEAGNYQLTYRQENESLCSQATTQTIEINEQPVPDFTWGTACVGELVSFENLTALNGNRLKNYNWSIEGTMFSSDLAPQYTFEESGNYQLTLEVETQGGCIQNISKNLLVSSKPTAFFELEQSIGAYPFALYLMMQDNPNEEIVEVFWILNEDTISNSSELSHTITEPGTYLLGLSVINEAGCKNEYYEQIKVREPSLDVSLSNLRIKKDQEFTSFILNISNRGSLVSERIDLTIDFGEYSLTESLEAQIYPEENRNFSLSTRLTDEQLRGLSKICISASPKAGERKDANPQNNRICTNLENGFKVMDIYPNPTINQFTIPLIIPENETITISMEDSNGRQVKFYNYSLEAGYNEVQIQRENLSPGIYFLRFRYQGQEKIKKIIFQ